MISARSERRKRAAAERPTAAAAGVIVAAWGYGAAFVALGAVALAGAALFLTLMPETAPTR